MPAEAGKTIRIVTERAYIINSVDRSRGGSDFLCGAIGFSENVLIFAVDFYILFNLTGRPLVFLSVVGIR